MNICSINAYKAFGYVVRFCLSNIEHWSPQLFFLYILSWESIIQKPFGDVAPW